MKRNTFRRAIMVAFAFAVAVTVGVITLFALAFGLGVQAITQQPAVPGGAEEEMAVVLNHLLDALVLIISLAEALTLLPAIILLVIGELAKIRSWMYYVPAGAIACAVMPLLLRQYSEDFTFSAPHYAVLALAGSAAGWMYWLIAGRDA
ncbi:MAG: hypothetical protein P8Y67_03145 [Alphaproteobacteria bacterium]